MSVGGKSITDMVSIQQRPEIVKGEASGYQRGEQSRQRVEKPRSGIMIGEFRQQQGQLYDWCQLIPLKSDR